MTAKYYILSKLHKHASAVLEETETTLIIQKLKLVQAFDAFTNDVKDLICFDDGYTHQTESKSDLSKVFDDVELTKDYWRVFEFFTGKKRKAVNANDTTN